LLDFADSLIKRESLKVRFAISPRNRLADTWRMSRAADQKGHTVRWINGLGKWRSHGATKHLQGGGGKGNATPVG
jgi:hypothetical protein